MGIVEEKFNFYDYIYKLLELLEHKYEKVSVIVPNYNYEHYIIERLKSIDNQTYPIYEIIYLDDASTDNSNEKVINYIDKSYNNIIIEYKRRWEQVPMCGTNRKQPVDERHTESTDGFMEQP